jgi:hypothetical protein
MIYNEFSLSSTGKDTTREQKPNSGHSAYQKKRPVLFILVV